MVDECKHNVQAVRYKPGFKCTHEETYCTSCGRVLSTKVADVIPLPSAPKCEHIWGARTKPGGIHGGTESEAYCVKCGMLSGDVSPHCAAVTGLDRAADIARLAFAGERIISIDWEGMDEYQRERWRNVIRALLEHAGPEPSEPKTQLNRNSVNGHYPDAGTFIGRNPNGKSFTVTAGIANAETAREAAHLLNQLAEYLDALDG